MTSWCRTPAALRGTGGGGRCGGLCVCVGGGEGRCRGLCVGRWGGGGISGDRGGEQASLGWGGSWVEGRL